MSGSSNDVPEITECRGTVRSVSIAMKYSWTVSAAWMQESTWRASKASRRHRDSAQAGCSGWQPDIDSERIGWFTGRVEGASCCLRPKKLHACAKQGRIKVGAVDWCCNIRPIQDIGPRPRTKKRKKIFSIWVVISLVGTISRKSLKSLPPEFKAKMHQIRFWLGLRPRPRWRSLQRSPSPCRCN